MQRQDIKTMIDRLDQLVLEDFYDNCTIASAIWMIEDLGNLVHNLKLENAKLKQDILQGSASSDAALQVAAMIDD